MSSNTNKLKRPEHLAMPTVWRRHKGKKPLADGRVPRFIIQDVPPELDDAVIEHMVTHFLRDELVCALNGVLEDPVSVRDFERMWRDMLAQRMVLVALVEDDDGVGRRVAGANMTAPAYRDSHEQYEGQALRGIFAAYNYLRDLVKPDIFTRYGVDCYLTALGLSVAPEYRGQGLGEQLLRARWDICKAVGIHLTVTWFSAMSSQIPAERVGFETLSEVSYEEYGDPKLMKIPTPTMKLMAARIT